MCINVNQTIHGLVENLRQEHYCIHAVQWDVISSKVIQQPPVNQLMFRISLIGLNSKIDKATHKILIDGEVFVHLIAKVGTVVKSKSKFLYNCTRQNSTYANSQQEQVHSFVSALHFNPMFQQCMLGMFEN